MERGYKLIAFTEQELQALHVPEYSFACFLASLAGRVLIGSRHIDARPACTDGEEVVAYFV